MGLGVPRTNRQSLARGERKPRAPPFCRSTPASSSPVVETTFAPDPANTSANTSGGTSLEGDGEGDGDDDESNGIEFSTTSHTPFNGAPFQPSLCSDDEAPLLLPPSLPLPLPQPLLLPPRLSQYTERPSRATVRIDPEKGRRFSSHGWREQSTVQAKRPVRGIEIREFKGGRGAGDFSKAG